MSKTYAQNQFFAAQMQAMYRHAEIVSGAYKFRNIQRGRENTPEEIAAGDTSLKFREMTDDEKLQNSLGIMRRQIDFMRECMEAIENEGK